MRNIKFGPMQFLPLGVGQRLLVSPHRPGAAILATHVKHGRLLLDNGQCTYLERCAWERAAQIDPPKMTIVIRQVTKLYKLEDHTLLQYDLKLGRGQEIELVEMAIGVSDIEPFLLGAVWLPKIGGNLWLKIEDLDLPLYTPQRTLPSRGHLRMVKA